MPNNAPIAQRTITVTIHGNNNDHYMTYSYWSPVKGIQYHQAPTCDLLCNRPTYFLFILDYESTINGWTITGTEPRHGSPALPTKLGPDNLSVSNYNDYQDKSKTYYFAINYQNTATGTKISVDPQEGNIPGGY
jgi:hypothetical protein